MSIGNFVVTLSSAEKAALVSGGVFDWSAEWTAGNSSACSNGQYFFEGQNADGPILVGYDGANAQIYAVIRGAEVARSASLGGNPAFPTMQHWLATDRLGCRFRVAPGEGARSILLRFGVNRCFGQDTVGVDAGAAIGALTGTVKSLGTSATTWSVQTAALATALSATHTANVPARVVVIGDSIAAPRALLSAVGSLLGHTGVCASLAQGGAKWADQNATFNASRYKADGGVEVFVIPSLGVNDIIVPRTAVQIATDAQTLITNLKTNNPTAKRILCQINPCHKYLRGLNAGYEQVRLDSNANYNGTGANNLTDVDLCITANQLGVGDANGSLQYQINDDLHLNQIGRGRLAGYCAAGMTTLGVL